MNGWIKLYRTLANHWLWDEKPYTKLQAWIDLLFMASYTEKKILRGNNLEIQQIGDVFTSEKKLMERWGWGKEKLKGFLRNLQEDSMITIPKADRNGTVINIVNYCIYQDPQGEWQTENPTENRPIADQSQTDSRPKPDTTKKLNNINNINNNIISSSSLLRAHARTREEITDEDDYIAFEQLKKLPLEAQLKFEDAAEELVEKYFNRECTAHDKATIYFLIEGLGVNPQMTDSDIQLLETAFNIAYYADSVNYGYIEGIFKNWMFRGIRTMSDYRNHEIQREQEKRG